MHPACNACTSLPTSYRHSLPTTRKSRQRKLRNVAGVQIVCRSLDEDNLHEVKLGPNVLSGIKDVRDKLKWSKATVITNQAASVDGALRLLHIGIEDQVDLLYGRKVQAIPDSLKWIDSFTVPGQSVAVRTSQSSTGSTEDDDSILKCLYNVASTPYQSRQESAYLSSSIIEILVWRDADGEAPIIAELPAGAQLQVSQVVGRGFASLFNSYIGLTTVMEDRWPLVMIASGAQGIAAMRSAVNWPPFQAYASSQKVTFYYFTESAVSAALVAEWDRWRDAGVDFRPVYTSGNGTQTSLQAVTHTLFEQTQGFESAVGNRVTEAAVLLAGFPGEDASKLFRMLTQTGVPGERILFCNFF